MSVDTDKLIHTREFNIVIDSVYQYAAQFLVDIKTIPISLKILEKSQLSQLQESDRVGLRNWKNKLYPLCFLNNLMP
jgi:hypothetical protein